MGLVVGVNLIGGVEVYRSCRIPLPDLKVVTDK